MHYTDKFLSDVTNGYAINQEQAKAYKEVEKSFFSAWSNRSDQIAYNQSMPLVPQSNFEVNGGIEIAGKLYDNGPNERPRNQEKLRLQTENSYQRLHLALSNPEIKYHLDGDIKELKSNLDAAIKDNVFDTVDNYFDKHSELSKRPGGKAITLIKLADLEKSNPHISISAKAGSFAYRVASTLRNISARNFD
jgi:hypothetical protein